MRPTLRQFVTRAAGATSAAMLATTAHAADQACPPPVLAIVDAWLAQNPYANGATTPGMRITAACKAQPQETRITIVASAYSPEADDAHDEDLDRIVIALVDAKAGVVRSAFKGIVSEDASVHLLEGSLSIDTARYALAPGVRAFGVDISSGAPEPRCGGGGGQPWRTLFVPDGDTPRIVLSGFLLSTWRYEHPDAICGSDGADPGAIETTTSTLALSPHATNGYADLVVTATTNSDANDRPSHRARSERHVLRYDGANYGPVDRVESHQLDPRIEPEAASSSTTTR